MIMHSKGFAAVAAYSQCQRCCTVYSITI